MKEPNQEKIRTLEEKETYKYLGILKKRGDKKKIRKSILETFELPSTMVANFTYFRKTRKLLETKLYSINLIKGIDAWAVSLVRYSGPFLKWTKEIKQMNQRTRKLMTLHKALHHRDDIDRLYVSRKEGGRRLTSIEDSVDASIQRLEDYIEKHGEGLIIASRNDTDNTKTK